MRNSHSSYHNPREFCNFAIGIYFHFAGLNFVVLSMLLELNALIQKIMKIIRKIA